MQPSYIRRNAGLPKRLLSLIWHHFAGQTLIYAVLALLELIRQVKPVTFLLLTEARIGEFAPRTDFFLRQLKSPNGVRPRVLRLTIVPRIEQLPRGYWVAIAGEPCNRQLLTMFKRYIPVMRNRFLTRLMNHNMTPRAVFTNKFKGSRFVYRLPLPTIEDHKWAETDPVLSFTDAEEARGKDLLKEMGIPEGAWFVCFHARDSGYLKQAVPSRDLSITDCRNCSSINYIPAMKYITSRGGYAVRVGAAVAERLPSLDDPQIIDYASDYRSDFGDIWLLAKCKFLMGCNSGITSVPLMFNVPVVDANSIVMQINPPNEHVEYRALGRRDIFLPKLIYSREKDRVLTFREIFESEVRYFDNARQFEKWGLEPLENSPEDILAVTKEMNERLDGRFTYTDEDEALQMRFRSLVHTDPGNCGHLPRVGAKFLTAHRDLLD